jgi:hypothetical protein
MIGTEVNIVDRTRAVLQATERAQVKTFAHAAATVRKTSQSLIEKSDAPARAGEPIHTRKGQFPKAIAYDATKTDAVIGAMASRVGDVGKGHEFGGEFRGEHFEPRPVMAPALELSRDRFAREWDGSIEN